ncbi:MAG: MBL fold metallo-hydrolase [Anaerolineae bacterium]|nr:MBL fold metallo-hydrolase [Anaerolineae bacterium]MDW8101750.1 MBL fold metallo-hydrolase [Anaerolineae bacterium]
MKVSCVVDDSVLPGARLLNQHGLSFLIEHNERYILFDTGPNGKVILQNLARLEIEPESLSAIVLSHAHIDHTGGLAAILERTPDTPVYAHPDIFIPRFSLREERLKDVSFPISWAAAMLKLRLILRKDPVEVSPGIWTSGDISPRTEPEGRSERHFARIEGRLVPDPYRDDIALILDLGNKLAVVCGCCHAGILNTLNVVKERFRKPVEAIFGGLHLEDADELTILRTGETLKDWGVLRLYINHCTGARALTILREILGDGVVPFPAGSSITL